MICKNCGAQTEGNFCNNCGAPLPKEVAGNNESMDAEYKVYNEEDAQKENQQQKNVKVTIKNKRGGSSRNTRTTQTKRAPLRFKCWWRCCIKRSFYSRNCCRKECKNSRKSAFYRTSLALCTSDAWNCTADF